MLLILFVGVSAFFVVYAEATEYVDPNGVGSLFLFGRMVLDFALGMAAFVLFPFRHRAPLAVVVAIVSISAVSSLAAGAAILGIVSISTRRRWREILLVAVICSGAMFVGEAAFPTPDRPPWWQLIGITIVVLGIFVVAGMYIGGRRQLLTALQEQADSARREQQAHLEQARVSERARIAREMHDVLAHRLSLVALHAGALEYRRDLSTEQTKVTAGVVRDNAHLALSELREVLGVLHDPVTAESSQRTLPQPSLAHLTGLLDDSRLAGTPVTLEIDPDIAGTIDSLAETQGRHLYRIIQEGLTNARKHAPCQPVLLHIGGKCGTQVTLEVSNSTLPGSSSPPENRTSGHGLIGLSERTRLAGGELTAGEGEHGVFMLKAWLPWKS